jgi:hypothetical protein
MPEYHFYETKQIVYEALIVANSEKDARKKYQEIDDSEKDVNDSDTIKITVCKCAPKKSH